MLVFRGTFFQPVVPYRKFAVAMVAAHLRATGVMLFVQVGDIATRYAYSSLRSLTSVGNKSIDQAHFIGSCRICFCSTQAYMTRTNEQSRNRNLLGARKISMILWKSANRYSAKLEPALIAATPRVVFDRLARVSVQQLHVGAKNSGKISANNEHGDWNTYHEVVVVYVTSIRRCWPILIFFHVSRNPGGDRTCGQKSARERELKWESRNCTHVLVTLIDAIETPPFVTLIDFSIWQWKMGISI